MLTIKTCITVGLTLLAMNGAAVAVSPAPFDGSDATWSDAPGVIAEGRYGGVSEAFVGVVRDAGTYAVLRGVLGELPEMSAEFFETNAVVAAFLGARPTAEHGVIVTRPAEGVVRISEAAVRGGATSPKAPTSPFTVVSVPMNVRAPLEIEVDDAWKKAMRAYQVSEGEFASRGGIAGRTETFPLEGGVRLVRLADLITVAFDLKSAGSARLRRLRTVATGVGDGSGGFQIPRLEGGGLVGWPNGGLRATGRLTNSNGLSLTFEPLPTDVSDGFEGRGKLEAAAVRRMDRR